MWEILGIWVEAFALIAIFLLDLKERKENRKDRQEQHAETAAQLQVAQSQAEAAKKSADAATEAALAAKKSADITAALHFEHAAQVSYAHSRFVIDNAETRTSKL